MQRRHGFALDTFHGVPDKPRLLRAVHDVLEPGGLFAIVNWPARPREDTAVLGEPRGPPTELRMRPDETVAAAHGSGLTFHREIELPPYHYATLFRRAPRGAASVSSEEGDGAAAKSMT